jgi:hypothetical protein
MASDDKIAAWQIANTIIPLTLLCLAIAHLTEKLTLASIILTPISFVFIILFLSRSFSLMHDCGHHSLFKSKHANRIAAFALSMIHAMPHHPWSRGHAFHHKHNGNWNRYRGPSALTTAREYEKKSKNHQVIYRLLRHPLALIPGGFYYLVIKPRVTLLAGLLELISKVISDGYSRISTRSWPTPPCIHQRLQIRRILHKRRSLRHDRQQYLRHTCLVVDRQRDWILAFLDSLWLHHEHQRSNHDRGVLCSTQFSRIICKRRRALELLQGSD